MLQSKILYKILFLTTVLHLLGQSICSSQSISITSQNSAESLALVQGGKAIPILVDPSDAKVVSIVAAAFASDVEAVTGAKPEVKGQLSGKEKTIIIAGTIGSSIWIDQLIASNRIDISDIKDNWESYQIETINNPIEGISKALVITGSDRRGTAYGIFELSKMMGVSPWIWWADVKPEKRESLYITPGRKVVHSPSVKYRGIFLNDEDWGLKPWAASKQDTAIHDIGPNTYAHIFELMLRLRANFIWPAMHDCTKAFYYYPENPKVADQYAIVVGASHCEPMLRNNVFEWKENFKNEYGMEPGEWRYDTNKDQIYKYWDDRLNVSHNYESFYTVGMRGIHDSGMPGPKDKAGKISLMEKVIEDQRGIFSQYFDDATKVPQLFCPYKEVLDLYQTGLKLPDDVTIVWADDNHGYIRQLSNPAEQLRSGSSGVYYHISYWGAPHDYLWLSSISPSLISYEMTKAWQFGANRLWIVNVGDIKPAEMETQFFMDLAWDVDKWTPENAYNYAEYWAEQTFGKAYAKEIASIKSDYFKLAQNGKPEHMRMLSFNDEIKQERLRDYSNLITKVDALKTRIPDRLQDTYFELIEYPAKGAARMNQKVLYAEMSFEEALLSNPKALEYASKSQQAFDQIVELTTIYNKGIESGKWDGMMSYDPRKLPVYSMPPTATEAMVADTSKIVQDDISKNKYLDNIPGASLKENIDLFSRSILAANYQTKHEVENEKILSIDGLGLGGKSISRYPFTGQSYMLDELERAPYVEYTLHIQPGMYNISVKCLPTQRIHAGRDVAYAISVNGTEPKKVSVDVSSSNRNWSQSVLRGYSEGITQSLIESNAETTIRIYLLETNLAISKIDLVRTE